MDKDNSNYDRRINFYLGKQLSNNVNIANTYSNKIHIDDFDKIKANKEHYQKPFKHLLCKTKHETDAFYVKFGDVTSVSHPLELAKNRCSGNEDSVLLRSLEFDRHWGNYYARPNDMPFNKKRNVVCWRGTTTGNPNKKGNRFDLVKRWFGKDRINIGFSNICQNRNGYKRFVKGHRDISWFLKFKYIISVEGNDKDSGINWKLNSNSLVFMPKPRVTSWLMETTLVPNVHYILLKDDFSDLRQKLNWCNNHPNKCKNIIKNAHKFMAQFANKRQEEQLEVDLVHKYFNIMKQIDENNTKSSIVPQLDVDLVHMKQIDEDNTKSSIVPQLEVDLVQEKYEDGDNTKTSIVPQLLPGLMLIQS